MSHFELKRKFTIEKEGRKGFQVYVYEHGKIFHGSPFNSYGSSLEAIGIKKNSKAIFRTIDTDKFYKQKYQFYSYKKE
jgi:hypothetical protein